jgi:hypothetical protein
MFLNLGSAGVWLERIGNELQQVSTALTVTDMEATIPEVYNLGCPHFMILQGIFLSFHTVL